MASCRPRQWTKNLLVFAAPLLTFRFEAAVWLPAAGALVAFCLIFSSIYLLNDCLDVAADRAHPSKRYRPIAAGLVSVPATLATAALLSVMNLTLAAWITPALAGVVRHYGLIQVGYCLQLKRQPLLDLFCIASGFLLLAIAGAVAAMLTPSPWVPTHGGPFGPVPGDREAQDGAAGCAGSGRDHPQSSGPLLITAAAAAGYLGGHQRLSPMPSGQRVSALNAADTSWMLLRVPFVLVGIFRYQLLNDPAEAGRWLSIDPDRTSEKPEEILLGDRGNQLTLAGWLVTTAVIGLLSRAS